MSQVYSPYINQILSQVYGGGQYGNNNNHNHNSSNYYGQSNGNYYGGGYGQQSSLMMLIEELLRRRNEGGGGSTTHNNNHGNGGVTRAEGDGTLSGDDRRVEWKGTSDNNYMKLRDLDDSMVKVKTGSGADVIDIDSSVSDTEVRVYDFSDIDQLRLEGDASDWDYEVDPFTGGDGGFVTFTNDFNDTVVKLKLEDLEHLGTLNSDNEYTFDNSIQFVG